MHAAFVRFDRDNSHSIDASELEALLHELGIDPEAAANAGGRATAAAVKRARGEGGGPPALNFEDFKVGLNRAPHSERAL